MLRDVPTYRLRHSVLPDGTQRFPLIISLSGGGGSSSRSSSSSSNSSGNGSFEESRSPPHMRRIPMYVRCVGTYRECVCVCVFCACVCVGEVRRSGIGGCVLGMSQPCMIQLDQMVSKKFSLMLILFM